MRLVDVQSAGGRPGAPRSLPASGGGRCRWAGVCVCLRGRRLWEDARVLVSSDMESTQIALEAENEKRTTARRQTQTQTVERQQRRAGRVEERKTRKKRTPKTHRHEVRERQKHIPVRSNHSHPRPAPPACAHPRHFHVHPFVCTHARPRRRHGVHAQRRAATTLARASGRRRDSRSVAGRRSVEGVMPVGRGWWGLVGLVLGLVLARTWTWGGDGGEGGYWGDWEDWE